MKQHLLADERSVCTKKTIITTDFDQNYFGQGLPLPTSDVKFTIFIELPYGIETDGLSEHLRLTSNFLEAGEKFPFFKKEFSLLYEIYEKCKNSEDCLHLSDISLSLNTKTGENKFTVFCICEKGKKKTQQLEKANEIVNGFGLPFKIF